MGEPQPTFEVTQYYEAAIASRGLGARDTEFRFLSLPRRMIHPAYQPLLDQPAALLQMLGLEYRDPLEIGQIGAYIAALLYAEQSGEDIASTVSRFLTDPGWSRDARLIESGTSAFADYLAFPDIVPFEESPWKLSSLSSLGHKSLNVLGNVSMIQGGAASAGVLFLGPHAPVALAAAGAGIGAFALVDGIGVVVGAADSPKAHEMFGNVRNGFRWLTHRPG